MDYFCLATLTIVGIATLIKYCKTVYDNMDEELERLKKLSEK